jgi:hypothetical protein
LPEKAPILAAESINAIQDGRELKSVAASGVTGCD